MVGAQSAAAAAHALFCALPAPRATFGGVQPIATVLPTQTRLRSRPTCPCSVWCAPTPWPGMDLPLAPSRGNGPPACPHNASRRVSHLRKRRDPRLRAASAPRPFFPLLSNFLARLALALASAHSVKSPTHVLCQASGTMQAASLTLCDMPYDPTVAARPSAPAAPHPPHNPTILHAHALHTHFAHPRRLRPATRRLRPAFRLRPPIQLRLANISLQHSNCATRQYQPQKANTQQEHSTTKHTAAHTKRYQATPGTHRIIRSRSKRSLRLSPSAPPFPIPRKNGSGAS